MENASKALLMAGGILVGVLILTLIATLSLSVRELHGRYEERIASQKIEQFNVNFTKYIGRTLTIHEVVTICNFARENKVTISSGGKQKENIKDNENKTYKIVINDYSEDGYITSIKFMPNL